MAARRERTFQQKVEQHEMLKRIAHQVIDQMTTKELRQFFCRRQQFFKAGVAINSGNGETMTSSAELQELYRQEQVSFEFLTRHKHDFNNCSANIGLIKTYFQDHHLEWTVENLEKALVELTPQLAPVAGAPKHALVPPPVAAAPPPPVPAPVVQPAAEPTLTMEQINSWDGPTMRKKMADPVTRKQIDELCALQNRIQTLIAERDREN